MIDEKKFHHTALAFLHQRGIRAHAHSFGDVLRARNLRTRHPVDRWLTIRAEFWLAIGTEFWKSHFDQAHSAITRRTELLMITVARHITAGLLTRFDDARAFRELMPHAIDLDVEQWCGRIRHILGKQERRKIFISANQFSRRFAPGELA